MEWVERLNNAINYIEGHLTEDIDYKELAKIAFCSPHHFQRIFSYMSDITLSEYIRRRRMTKAAVDLQSSNEKVIDIGLKYGYDSPTAFNRAFQGVHGMSPSQAREDGAIVKAFPPISFKITIKGVAEMEYRIEKKDAFRIIGVSEKLYNDMEKNFEIVPKMWGNVAMNGTIPKLAGMMNGEPKGLLGVTAYHEEGESRYYIAVASNLSIDSSLEEFIVPEATWAIFYGEGTNLSIQELEKNIIMEWLPSSGYEYGNAPDIEVYLNPDPQNAKYEVWIPVIKKED